MRALTIPFRFRPGHSRNGKSAPSEFLTELNVGTYVGYTFGVVRYNYTKDQENNLSKRMLSVDAFLNLSRIELDKDNTHLADSALTSNRQVAALSPGIAVMSSLYNFRFGLFLGWDFAFGDAGQKWDFNRRAWIGIGFGYNIGMIWAPSN